MSLSGWSALAGVETFSCLTLPCAEAELLWAQPTHPAASTIDAARRAHRSAAVCGLSWSMKTGSYNPTHETTAQGRPGVSEFIAVSTTAGSGIRRGLAHPAPETAEDRCQPLRGDGRGRAAS